MTLNTLRIYLLLALLPLSTLNGKTPSSPPVVRAVMFWMDGCPHCHYVLDEVLPPIQEKYGDQLEIRLIELVGGEEVVALYQLAESRGIPKEEVGVPLLVIGEHTLIGADQIPRELPGLIDANLGSGGVGWPEIPGLEVASRTTTLSAPNATGGPISGAIVEAVLFSTPECHDCQLVIAQAITPAKAHYGGQFQLTSVDIVTSEDVEYLYQVAAKYGLEQDQVDLPMLIIGGSVLIGEQIITELPGLMNFYLNAGGVGEPLLPERATPPTQNVAPFANLDDPQSGFALAIAVMVVMLVILIYCGVVFLSYLRGSTSPWAYDTSRFEWLIPLLVLVGMAVAAYLAYVETQAVQAICGPVGDCNAVQSSPYARLFGVLPVGVLGLAGYVLILVAWLIQRGSYGRASAWAGLAQFGMVFGGVIFSLYLTFLEPFVIRAVCAWCLTSAVIMTVLLLLSLSPGLRAIDKLKDRQNVA